MIKNIESVEQFETSLEDLRLTDKQFAELISYSPDAIRKWRKSGKVPAWIKFPLAYLSIIRENEKTAKKLGISDNATALNAQKI